MTNIWKIDKIVRTEESSQSQSNLTDADDDIEELTEEEAKGVFVEFIVDVLTVVDHQLPERSHYYDCWKDTKWKKITTSKCGQSLLSSLFFMHSCFEACRAASLQP